MPASILNFAEWLPDLPSFQNPGSLIAKNVFPDVNSYRPVKGPEEIADALPEAANGVFSVIDKSNAPRNFAGTASGIYEINGTTVTDRSKGGGYNAEAWQFTQWGNKVIAVDANENPQIIDLDGGAAFADLAGSPPKARHVAVVRDFVMLGDLDEAGAEYRSRLRWSGINDETTWSGIVHQSDHQDIVSGNGGRIQAVQGGEYAAIFQERAVFRGDYIGGQFIYQFDQVEHGRGAFAPRGVVSKGGLHFYLSEDGFYAFNGESSKPLSANKVSRHFFNDLSFYNPDLIQATIDPVNTLVMWAYCSNSNNATSLDKLIAYNWRADRWAEAEIDLETLGYLTSTGYTVEDLDTFGDVDSIPGSMDDAFFASGVSFLGGISRNHKLVNFSGEPLAAEIETSEKQLSGGSRSMVTNTRPLIEGGGEISASLGHRSRLNDPVTYEAESVQNGIGDCPQFNNDRYHRVRVKITGEWDHAQGVEIDHKPDGRI